MDHAIKALELFWEVEVDQLREEWQSGEYEKLSECPSYSSAKALTDAINSMRKYLDWETLKLKDLVREGEE